MKPEKDADVEERVRQAQHAIEHAKQTIRENEQLLTRLRAEREARRQVKNVESI